MIGIGDIRLSHLLSANFKPIDHHLMLYAGPLHKRSDAQRALYIHGTHPSTQRVKLHEVSKGWLIADPWLMWSLWGGNCETTSWMKTAFLEETGVVAGKVYDRESSFFHAIRNRVACGFWYDDVYKNATE